MIFFPLQMLINAGICDILISTRRQDARDFLRLLDKGREFALKDINHINQEGEGGISNTLARPKTSRTVKGLRGLGDNIIQNDICGAVQSTKKEKRGAVPTVECSGNPHSNQSATAARCRAFLSNRCRQGLR